MDERLIVRQATEGDKNAFAHLYTMYKDPLYRYAYFRLGSAEDAEDAVSMCIVAAYENIYSLRSEKAFKSWIFRILHRCCCAKVKEQSEAAYRAAEEELVTVAADSDRLSPELSEAFSVLSDEDRDIVLLAVIAGYNSREIGSMMSLKPATVRSRLSRGLAKMRTFLE